MLLIILKLKKCVSIQLKKLRYLLRHVPDQYKISKMCDKVILENPEKLKYVSDC